MQDLLVQLSRDSALDRVCADPGILVSQQDHMQSSSQPLFPQLTPDKHEAITISSSLKFKWLSPTLHCPTFCLAMISWVEWLITCMHVDICPCITVTVYSFGGLRDPIPHPEL